MKYFSMFSGIGGFEYGFTKDWKCVGFSEIDKYATAIYRYHFQSHKNFGDAREIISRELPDFDLLCGGFPCQSFSIAGKRRGFKDTRGTLFFEIARILEVKRPKFILLENVKGLLNHNKGKTFKVIIQTLEELGYDIQWMVLNSKFFGVPQNRERVFIIGNIRGTRRPKILPFKQYNKIYDEKNREKHIRRTWISAIDSRYGQRLSSETYVKSSQADRINLIDGISPTVPTASGGRHIPLILASRGRNPDNPSDRTKGSPTEQRLELNNENVSNTLSSVQKDNLLFDGKIRRLTPIECERLQGFPDNWTKYGLNENDEIIPISDTQRYKCLGNAVTTNVIKSIVSKIYIK